MEKLYNAYWQGRCLGLMIGQDEVEALSNFIFEDFRKDRSRRPMKALRITAIHN